MKTIVATLALACVVAVFGVAGVVYFGLINVGADDPHSGPVHAFLDAARNRSVEVRAKDIEVPDLNNEAQIRAGAGNYDSMCVGCHLAPGMAPTELSDGLYPAPPSLAEAGIRDDPAQTFWVIKHGIKATGMPAWGKSMADPYIWGMVAFLQKLPDLDEREYRSLVASSGGHQHGGGETAAHGHDGQQGETGGDDHHQNDSGSSDHHGSTNPDEAAGRAVADDHDQNMSDDHHASDAPQGLEKPSSDAEAKGKSSSDTHVHADGKQHDH